MWLIIWPGTPLRLSLQYQKPIDMKKYLSLLATSLLLPVAANAEQLTFGYCDQSDSWFVGSQTVGTKEYGAIFISADKTKEWSEAGGCVNGLYMRAYPTSYFYDDGSSDKSDVNIFLTYDLDEAPFYEQTIGYDEWNRNGWNTVNLDHPYKVDAAKGFYVGYWCECVNSRYSSIVFDYADPGDSNACWYGEKANGEQTVRWNHDTSNGNLQLLLLVNGDFELKTELSITKLALSNSYRWATFNDTNNLYVTIDNTGDTSMKDVTIEYTIADGEPETQTLTKDINLGTEGQVTLRKIEFPEGHNIPFTARITAVNGQPYDGQPFTAYFDCADRYSISDYYKHTTVAEVGLGTFNGYSVNAILDMEKSLAEINDGSLICIAAHYDEGVTEYGYSADPMRCESYIPFSYYARNLESFLENHLIGQFPVMTIDRVQALNAFPNMYMQIKQNATTRKSYPAFANVELEADYNGVEDYDGKPSTVNLTAKSTFWFDENDPEYKMAFVLTENHVGPYKQVNMYDQSQIGYYSDQYGIWGDAGVEPEVYHDYVARDIFDVYGLDDSIEAGKRIEAKKEYTTSYQASLSNVGNLNNCNIIAMIIDGKTGEIANATMIPAPEYISGGSGVCEAVIENEDVPVYYTLQGVKVENPVRGQLYIVRKGNNSFKAIYQ